MICAEKETGIIQIRVNICTLKFGLMCRVRHHQLRTSQVICSQCFAFRQLNCVSTSRLVTFWYKCINSVSTCRQVASFTEWLNKMSTGLFFITLIQGRHVDRFRALCMCITIYKLTVDMSTCRFKICKLAVDMSTGLYFLTITFIEGRHVDRFAFYYRSHKTYGCS